MEGFISKLPKAELHVHIIGTMTSDLCIQIANRNGVQIDSKETIENRRKNFKDLNDFLFEFNFCSSLLKTSQDFYDVAYNYLTICKAENILYAEIFFSTAFYNNLGISFSTIFEAFLLASMNAKENLGVRAEWILMFVKHISIEQNRKMLLDSADYKDKIIAVGIGGAEVGYSACLFKELFNEARRLGYKNFTAHSGEEGDPSYIIDSLYYLQVTRIDHGVRCLEDPFLIKFLANNNI